MTKLEEILMSNNQYAIDDFSRITRYIGIPLIAFSLILFSSWFNFGLNSIITIPFVWFVITVLTIYYLKIDLLIGLILGVTFIVMTLIAGIAGNYMLNKWSFITFLVAFCGGWIVLLNRYIFAEKQKRSLKDILIQILLSPLILCAEILIRSGNREDLEKILNLGIVEDQDEMQDNILSKSSS